MRKQLLLTVLALLGCCTAAWADVQINEANFPDANFRNYLLRQKYGQDGVLTDAEIAWITSINVYDRNIQSLKGIEYFTALTELSCSVNQLTELDVSKNTALKELFCSGNQLTELDVSKNTALTGLYCYKNELTALDVSKNTALTTLRCYSNQIKDEAMDALVESLPTVSSGSLDVIYNANEGNVMTVAQVAVAKAKGWTPYYYYNLTWKEYVGFKVIAEINEENFPDENFRKWVLKEKYGKDGVLTYAEIAGVKIIDVNNKNIQSLKGIEFFTALTQLSCYKNELTALDVSQNTALTTLQCYSNQIKDEAMDALVESLPTVSSGRLDVIYNANEGNVMTDVQVAAAKAKGWTPYCYNSSWNEYPGTGINDIKINAENFPDERFRRWVLSQEYGADILLTEDEIAGVKIIDVNYKHIQNLKGIEYFTALERLSCYDNQLTALDVSKNTKLTELSCDKNQLTELDVSKNTALKMLICGKNQLTVLDVSKNTALIYLSCGNNQLRALDVSQNTTLELLFCGDNQLRALDVSKNTALTLLWCNNNQLTALDVSKNTALTQLDCGGNQLTALDVSKNTALERLVCSSNQLTALDVSQNTALITLQCYSNQIKDEAMDALVESLPTVSSGRLDVIYNENEGNVMTVAQVAAAKAKGWTPYCYSSSWNEYPGTGINDIKINAENFPDENFRKWVLSQEYGADILLTEDEIAEVKIIDVNYKYIQNLKGIEYFTALTTLRCNSNQLTDLDISKNTALTTLSCGDNQLTKLNTSGCIALETLLCGYNRLTELDVSKNTALKELFCAINQLTALDVSGCTALARLDCSYNRLTALDVSQNTALTSLYCYYNQLTALDVSKNTALTQLDCSKNELTALDLSKNTELEYLHCYMNQIKGAAMDALVESLPTVSSGRLDVIWNEEEQNVMTVAQVAAAKTKGWTPFYYDGRWYEYEGSVGISRPTADSGNNGKVYDLSGRRLGKPQRGLNIIGGKKVAFK